MITFYDITRLFSYESKYNYCIEIKFSIIGSEDFQNCWMGKMPVQKKSKFLTILPIHKPKQTRYNYWFGLPGDETKSYDYDNFNDFSTAPVFNGKSLKEIWKYVDILSIDGIDPKERLADYLNKQYDTVNF